MKIFSSDRQISWLVLSNKDWSGHPLGPIESWPSILVHFLNFIFNSKQPCFIFWGKYCFYNDGYLPILGEDKHPQAMGSEADLVWPEIWHEDTNPQYAKAMSGEATWNVDRMVPILRNGKTEEAYFTYGYSPLLNEAGVAQGVLVTAVETTEKVISKNELSKKEEKLNLALQVTKIGFYDWDMINDFVTFNHQMQEDWGFEAATTLAVVMNLIHPSDFERVNATIESAISKNEPYHCIYRVVRPDQKIVWVETKGRVKYLDQKPVRFFGTSLDVSEIVHARYQLEEVIKNLESERELRDQFVAALSHDLRTPLTAAKIGAQLMLRNANNSFKVQTMASRIVNNMDRADMMIRDLLDASRMKAGEKIDLERKDCDLNHLIEETVIDLSSIHGERFHLKIHDKVKGQWDCDALKRVIENLASNAIKYGKTSSPITVSLAKLENLIEISIHNEGAALSHEEQKIIFEPYRRATSAEGFQKGWGIGLTLVRGFVEAHGGEVSVKSTEELGTTFYVKIPIDAALNPVTI